MNPVEDFLSLTLDPVEVSPPPLLFALKHGDTFLVVNALGDVLGDGDGLFQDDTRVLSRFRLRLGGKTPSLLGSTVSRDNVFFTANLTNRPLPLLGGSSAPEGVIQRVRGSNAGHLLFTGLPTRARGERVAAQLLSPPLNSGWGIRTLASGEVRFNPMSYHNGSVWPHDTGICTAGIARYGERDRVVRLMSGIFEAAVKFEMRLPELFCGFSRAAGEGLVAYPAACLPQAWSAGAVFMMLQACLGLSVDAWRGQIHVNRPRLPIGIDQLTISRLSVGDATVDLTFKRVGERVVAFPEGRDPSPVPVILHA